MNIIILTKKTPLISSIHSRKAFYLTQFFDYKNILTFLFLTIQTQAAENYLLGFETSSRKTQTLAQAMLF